MQNTQIFLFDGAFGTYYASLTGSDKPCEMAVLTDSKTVLQIHRQYIEAGIDAIKTNTFGANSGLKLGADNIKQILTQGYQLAQQSVKGSKVQVFADIGPIPVDENSDNLQEYIDIADVFLDLGADNFLFETMSEYTSIIPAIKHIKSRNNNSKIIVSFAVRQDGYTKAGHYYKQLLNSAANNQDIDAVGLNCLCGPMHILELVKDLHISKAMSVMPNSGYPETVGNRTVYIDNTQYFAQKLLDLRRQGISILGGCCGTTPNHIRLSREMLNNFDGLTSASNISNQLISSSYSQDTISYKNKFEEKLKQGKKIIAVELKAPIDANADYLIDSANKLQKAKADIITIADNPLARSRADSFMMSMKIHNETGIDVLPHLTCRDKNMISIKSSMLGLCIDKICNVFAVTGDPIIATERNSTKGVFDFNSIGLIKYIDSLNQNIFSKNPFFVGAALNTSAENFEVEILRARKKIDAGAKFFLTQPILSDEGIQKISYAKSVLNAYILAGIIPPSSYKNALFLNNEVSGINIPKELIEKLIDTSAEQASIICAEFSIDIIKKVFPYSDGCYIISQSKNASAVCKIVDAINN